MSVKQPNRGLWWQFPSFNDTPVGPWSLDLPRMDDDPVHHWKRAIDWMAECGVNVFIGNGESFLRGARHSACPDWPFVNICRWPAFPHAQMSPTSHVEYCRKLYRTILDHFHKKNIRVFMHHYNFFAPYGWAIRQPELVERRRRPDGTLPDPTTYGNGVVARSNCPNASIYRDFMRASWQELFQHLPDLDGLLISLGESNRCACQACTGGVQVDAGWKHSLRKEQLSTFGSFVGLYVDTLNGLGKEPMVRCWHGGGDEAFAKAMPKGPTYLIKYSGFNSIDCGPDPIYRFWKQAGHRLWVVHEVAGQEPGGPCTWMNPEWVHRVNERAVAEMGIDGSVAFHNTFAGRLDLVYPPVFFNMEAALRFFAGRDYDEVFWKDRARELMGPHGPTYLEAGKLYSQMILNIDKIVGMPTDGIGFCSNIRLLGDPITGFPGVIGELGPNGLEPHPWVRGDLAVLRRYREYLDDQPWTPDIYTRAIPKGQVDPIAFLKEKWELVHQGRKIVEDLQTDAEGPFYTIHRLVLLNARWADQHARFWYHFVRAKVLWWGANSLRTELAVQRRLAADCLAALDEAVDAIWELQGLYYEFPPQYMHWGKALNGATLEDMLSHYRRIRDAVRDQLAPLLEDAVFKWPTIAHFHWPE